jgi:GT2 family glycosyltransferase
MATSKVNDPFHVTAVIVSHDGALWLPKVVAALSSQTRKLDQIIAVDNGSKDNSTSLLKAAKFSVLNLPRDTGFGDALYQGVEQLEKVASENNQWIWVIHDDCAPKADALEKLLAELIDRPNVAMAGPKLLGWHDRTHLLEVGISITNSGTRWTGLESHEYDQGQHDGVREVLSVSTAGALIRRDVFEELGGYDPQLALFRDDVDFGWRIRMAGHSVIVVTDAIAFHAQAAASERRSVDVEGALLHRPLLLDRRNSTYVLLVNSPVWLLPWLTLQLISSAAIRAIGYLLAKLPGYAGDEFLAITTLIFRPAMILAARKERRIHKLLSPRIIKEFIPPRLTQYRSALNNSFESMRNRIFAKLPVSAGIGEEFNEDADLLTPSKSLNWGSIFKRPQIMLGIFLFVFVFLSSTSRLGSLIGGSLATTPHGVSSLWRSYVESWHQVGMGSSAAMPPWIALLSLLSLIVFGKPAVLVSLLIFLAPILMATTANLLFKRITESVWLRISASVLYGLSPVALASVNTGRLGTLVFLILLPLIVLAIPTIANFESISWRRIFITALLLSIATSFTLTVWVALFAAMAYGISYDLRAFNITLDKESFDEKLKRRIALLLTPLILTMPWSLSAVTSPSRFLLEPGIALSGGGPNLAFFGNPGGIGALPWWLISPLTIILIVALFVKTGAREVAQVGFGFLLLAVVSSAFSISGNGSTLPIQWWSGIFMTVATLAALCTGVLILSDLRSYLILTNINYRHILSALLLAATLLYSFSTLIWSAINAASSPVHTKSVNVLPEYLGAQPDAKTLVLREIINRKSSTLAFYISRGSDIALGEPDVAPTQDPAIARAVIELSDGSSITTSNTFAEFGIKYIFAKNPISKDLVSTIDSLGGFLRTSATSDGIVWKVSQSTGRLFFTDINGAVTLLNSGAIGVKSKVPGPGILTLTENYDLGWQVLQNGLKLSRSENNAGLPQFEVLEAGEFTLIHDGTSRRGVLSLQLILWSSVIILALPAGRRKREISEAELT